MQPADTPRSARSPSETAREPDHWLVWSYEHDAWWGPGHSGYTDNLLAAGLYTEAQAFEIVRRASKGNEEAVSLAQAFEDARIENQRHPGRRVADVVTFGSSPSGARAGGEPVLCGVCLGRPLASGRPCICGGVGTEQAEMHGLRVRCFELEDELAALRASQGGDGGAAVQRLLEQAEAACDALRRTTSTGFTDDHRQAWSLAFSAIRALADHTDTPPADVSSRANPVPSAASPTPPETPQ